MLKDKFEFVRILIKTIDDNTYMLREDKSLKLNTNKNGIELQGKYGKLLYIPTEQLLRFRNYGIQCLADEISDIVQKIDDYYINKMIECFA